MEKILKNRAAVKKHYEANKEKYFEKNKKETQKKIQYITYLRGAPCMDCLKSYPYYVMEFDHRGEAKKFKSVTSMVSNSWKQILAEIDKCDVVCANCHAVRTYNRRSVRI